MSRLAIPISAKKLWATGDVKLWVEVLLWLRGAAGNYVDRIFRVDSGTEITTFPAFDARQLGLVVPASPAPVRHEQTGLEVRSGMLRFRIDGMDQTEYGCLPLPRRPERATESERPVRHASEKPHPAARTPREAPLLDGDESGRAYLRRVDHREDVAGVATYSFRPWPGRAERPGRRHAVDADLAAALGCVGPIYDGVGGELDVLV
jgi:hypothetical protein